MKYVEENTLDHEVHFIENYLKIEKIRFGEYLSYSINIEESCKDIKIPHLILQPIIENSIKHGISKIETEGIITIDAEKKGNNVVITIADNGPGMELPYNTEKAKGIGLANIISRYETIYGTGDSINFLINKWGGLTVTVLIPNLD
jgi:LytS/YehU family sensor histidine kinase